MTRAAGLSQRLVMSPARRAARRRAQLWRLVAFIVLMAVAASMVIPFVWMFSTSLKKPGAVFIFPPQWIPRPLYWTNYVRAFTVLPFGRYMLNTLFYATFATLGQLLSCSLGGFAFARLRFPGKNLVFLALLATLMVPHQVTMIPLFLLYKTLGWLDSFKPLIVPTYLGGAFGVFLFRQYFLTIPFELVDAAKIDGASWFTIYRRVMLPLAVPALATLGVFVFMGAWNDLLGPLIYLNTMSKYTITMGLTFFQAQHRVEWGMLMAASVVSLLPVLTLYFMGARKYFVQGIATVGIKR
jgi:multiple sugar transport system permease protein